jgi:hypothetical protein
LVNKKIATRTVLGVAVALATATVAGYGLFRPAAPSAGMARQIADGERVSAATRAHERPAATPTPARLPRRITGGQVTAIGDSVMAASAMALHSVLPGIYIDAQPSRQMPAGLAIIRSLAASGQLRPVVVVGLGTNYLVTVPELRELVRLVGPHRHLVLINTYVPDSWSEQVNTTEAAFVHRHPGIVLADWFDAIRDRTYLLWPDGIHPQLPGTMVYAHLVNRAVQATRRVPAPAPAGLAPLASRGTAPPPPLRQRSGS